MKDAQIEQINREYEEYCSSQTKRNHALPFVIWLKYKKLEFFNTLKSLPFLEA